MLRRSIIRNRDTGVELEWIFPADAEKPAAARIKHGQYIGSMQYQKYIKPNRNKQKDGVVE